MATDPELVARATGGDREALSELYERYFDPVYDFLTRLVRDRTEAADIAQDTFIKAMAGIGGLANGASFKSWLFTIARNTALNRLERAARVRPLATGASDADEGTDLDVVDPSRFADPEEAYEAERLAAIVWEAARALEPRQYSVLDLNVRQGFSSAEIADILGVSKNNASVMVNRMKQTLQDAIGALALLRQPFRRCAELNAVLAGFETDEITPEVRRAIDRHTAGCAVCNERRRALASPFAIIGGFGVIRLDPGRRQAILDGALVASRSLQPVGDHAPPGAGAAGAAALASTAITPAAPPARRRPSRRVFALVAALLLLVATATTVAIQLGSSSLLLADSQSSSGPLAAPPAGSSPTPAAAPPETQPALAGASSSELPTPSPSIVASPSLAPVTTPTPRPATPPPTQRPTPTPTRKPTPRPTPTPTPCPPSLKASPSPLQFGGSATQRPLAISATGCPSAVPFKVSSDRAWLTTTPGSGSLAPGSPFTVIAKVDRAQLPFGLSTGHLTIKSNGSQIQVTVEVIK